MRENVLLAFLSTYAAQQVLLDHLESYLKVEKSMFQESTWLQKLIDKGIYMIYQNDSKGCQIQTLINTYVNLWW